MCLEEATFTVEQIPNDQLNSRQASPWLLLYLLYGIWSANNQHLPLRQVQRKYEFRERKSHKYSRKVLTS